MKRPISLLFCITQLFLGVVYAQDTVTFTGQVTRHQTVELNVAVEGSVYIHYGYHDNHNDYERLHDPEIQTAFSIAVPFTIPAGQRSTSYRETINWSLAGSIDNGHDHDFLRVSVRCLQNCTRANARDSLGFSNIDGITGSNRNHSARTEERYGTSDGTDGYDRAGGYIVNLKLLPKYAYISGTLVLPDGKTAPEGLNIQLFGMDHAAVGESSTSTWWVQPFQQLVRFPTGSSEMSFRFAIDLDNLTTLRAGEFIFGYKCASTTCNNLGLVSDALFDSDADRLISNVYYYFMEGVSLDNFLVTDDENDFFTYQLPKPITMLGSNKQAIQIIQNLKRKPFENRVTGRIIVENYNISITCEIYTPSYEIAPIDFSSDERCIFPVGLGTINTVSETPFTINDGDAWVSLDINVQESDQYLLDPYYNQRRSREYQRIKVICETGCESPKLKNSGYYQEQSKYLMANSAGGARQFLLTQDFSNEPLIISLENLVALPYLELLLDDEEEKEISH